MIIKTNILDYISIVILLIIIEKKKCIHFYMFKATELNYNIYDKELLAVFVGIPLLV